MALLLGFDFFQVRVQSIEPRFPDVSVVLCPIDLFLATMGGEFYSDFLGGGRRKYLNPFIGWTLGYARFDGNNEAVLGFSAGVELFKTRAVTVDLQGRALGMFLSSAGSHVAVQPILGANVAF
jgi:hypothetical protein